MNATYADEVKAYRRELLLCCLHRMGVPSTAAEVAEYALSLAAGEGHDRALFAPLSPQTVAGILRGMEQGGGVQRGAARYDPAKGREQPRWYVPTADARYPVPMPPEEDVAVTRATPAPAGGSPYDHLSREQMLALLEVQDDIAGALSRLKQASAQAMDEIEAIVGRARARLAAAGVRAP